MSSLEAIPGPMNDTASVGPILSVGTFDLRFLGWEQKKEEAYVVCFREAKSDWEDGRLTHLEGPSWTLVDGKGMVRATPALGTPHQLFALVLDPRVPDLDMTAATPHWPRVLRRRLGARRSSGPCTIALDGAWFVTQLTQTAIDHPLLFPGAERKLGLQQLRRAAKVLSKADAGVLVLLERALKSTSSWTGEGRLIGESTWGDLTQVGTDLADGCRAARGTGLQTVTFEPGEPMGLGFGPVVPSPEVAAGEETSGSAGTGLEVHMVEPGGVADAAGVRVGMVVKHPKIQAFEELLDDIDARRDAKESLELTFETAAPLTHWYAVEMPAAEVFEALGEAPDAGVGTFDGMCGDALLWREPIPRVFFGDPGSLTCAHIDICPQVQVAHGLSGTKVLGVASHDATPRLQAEHAAHPDSVDEGATIVPTDRKLTPHQASLLSDPEVSLVVIKPGDIAVLHSGALHFASNGAESLNGALYHGLITAAGLPRLRLAAAEVKAEEGEYAGHLNAAGLLKLVHR